MPKRYEHPAVASVTRFGDRRTVSELKAESAEFGAAGHPGQRPDPQLQSSHPALGTPRGRPLQPPAGAG